MRNCWGCGKEIEKGEYRCPECQEKFEKGQQKFNKKVDAGKIKPYFYLGDAAFKPYLTVLIIFVNAIVIVLMHLSGYMSNEIGVAMRFGAQYTDAVLHGDWWRLATSWFVHFGLMHFAMNMFSLWIIGSNVEGDFGSLKFAAIYVLSGLGSSLATLYFGSDFAVSAGASGAICGVMGFAYVYARVKRVNIGRLDSNSLFSWIFFVQVYGFLVPNIGWLAHLGGLIAGALIGFVAAKLKRSR
jgi:rhomboid protease GluP